MYTGTDDKWESMEIEDTWEDIPSIHTKGVVETENEAEDIPERIDHQTDYDHFWHEES